MPFRPIESDVAGCGVIGCACHCASATQSHLPLVDDRYPIRHRLFEQPHKDGVNIMTSSNTTNTATKDTCNKTRVLTQNAEIGTRPRRLMKRRSSPGNAPQPSVTQPQASAQPTTHDTERMFLTPRVIDSGSYDEMSTNLRALIEQASGLTTQLTSIVERAEATATQLKANAKRYDERLNLGARLFETVCKRAEEVDAIAQDLGDRVDYIKQFETTVNSKHYTFCTGLQTEVDQALANLRLSRSDIEEELDTQQDKLTKQIINWEEIAQHLNERLDGMPAEIKSSSQPTINEINELINTVRSLTEVNEEAVDEQDVSDTPTLYQILRQVDDAKDLAETTQKEVERTADRCAAVRNLMGQEMMTAVDTMDQLAGESESLQMTIDAATTLASALAGQTDVGEQRLEKACNKHIRTIDKQIQDQTGKLKSMKSEVVGITIELDQRKQAYAELLTEHAGEINAATQTIKYLKRWENYLLTVEGDHEDAPVPPALQAVLENAKAVVDGEFDRIRSRFANIAEVFEQTTKSPTTHPPTE